MPKDQYLKQQLKIASQYTYAMGNAWFNALASVSRLGPQTIERNDIMVKVREEYDAKFKNLSKSARILATAEFLQGFLQAPDNVKRQMSEFKRTRVLKYLPDASTNPMNLQMLDEHVLMEYYKEYNRLVSNPNKNTLKEPNKLRTYEAAIESIRSICK